MAAVEKATKTWTGQLVDLTGRNNLLYYRDLKVGTLPLDNCPRSVIYKALAGKAVLLSKLFPEQEDCADAIKRARSVRNKANAHFEERGMETLYLACGMATWSGQKSSATPAAPVLLVPIRLAARGAAQEEFEVTVTGELEVNPTFLQLLKAEFEIGCDPTELLESAGIEGIIDTPEELDHTYAWLRQHCSAIPNFSIEERFVIGNFSYARMPMVLDLENSLETMAEHEIVAALAGDKDAQAALRQAGAATEIPSPDFVPPADEFLVLDADASQNCAINAVLAGKSLIIRGPPGTGKSQTISNLVSAPVARGKRVLFVAEKRAAIDAVLRRLDDVDLGDLVLDLHGGVSSKRQTAEALNKALVRTARLAKPNIDNVHRRLVQRRKKLNAHVDALHQPRPPWQLSFFEAQCRLLALPDSAATEIRFRGPVLESLSEDKLAEATEDLQSYVGLGGLTLATSGSPWARARVVSEEEEGQERRGEVESLRRQLPETLAVLARAGAETGLKDAETVEGWSEHFELWHRARTLFEVWQPSIFELSLDQVIEDSAPLERSAPARISATLISGDYRAARRALREGPTGRTAAVVARTPRSGRGSSRAPARFQGSRSSWGHSRMPGRTRRSRVRLPGHHESPPGPSHGS